MWEAKGRGNDFLLAFTAPSLSEELLGDRALDTLAVLMGTFPSSPTLQVSTISALGVGLGCWPEGRLQLLSQHGNLLDLVLAAVQNFPENEQVLEYACSFMALLMTEGKGSRLVVPQCGLCESSGTSDKGPSEKGTTSHKGHSSKYHSHRTNTF